ncbi:uncharacterized protein LOC100209659 [Hydra vulgaris]|uniref:uncharacterized protein LOC100209659 n=1 Tax=Hydra vulgaris TaxID=6087 RepID=UPI001F5F56D3|nr:uncharacterized protein LOC100209659 isoform X1 [Hydra vulgaris]
MKVIFGVVLLFVVTHGLDLVNNEVEETLKKNNLVAVLSKLEQSFDIYFDLKLNSFSDGFRSVIHLTIGEDNSKYGDRIPGIWVSNQKLLVAFAINDNKNEYFESKPLQQGQWINIHIRQHAQWGRASYTIYINNKKVYTLPNLNPQVFTNVKVYAGDPWYEAQDGSIKMFNVTNGLLYLANNEVEETLKKNNLVAVLSKLEQSFDIYFDLKLNSFSDGFRSVIHLTIGEDNSKYGDRIPGIWVSNQKLLVAFAINDNKNEYFESKPLQQGQWINIHIRQHAQWGRASYTIYINNKKVYTLPNLNPQVFTNVKVYAGDPWYEAQDGSIKMFNVTNGLLYLVNNEVEETLKKNNLVAVLSKLEQSFDIYFDLKLNSFSDGFRSVIHLTIGEDNSKYGDRIPGIWVSNQKLLVAFAINDNKNEYFESKPLQQGQWINIHIRQHAQWGRASYTIYINNKKVYTLPNLNPQVFTNVKVYAGDPWYEAQDGSIKKFNVTNGLLYLVNNEVEETLKKNNLVAVLSKLEQSFDIYFDLKLNSFSDGFRSVIHLTIGEDNSKYGDRIPGIWVSNQKLLVAFAINDNKNEYFESKPLQQGQWINIHIRQHAQWGRASYTIYINNKKVYTLANLNPQVFTNVKIYAGDPWYEVQDGSIKKFNVTNGFLFGKKELKEDAIRFG